MKTKIFLIATLSALLLSSCGEELLDRPQLTNYNDDTFWDSEAKLRLYSNEYYEHFFAGYGSGGRTEYAALNGYLFNDDVVAFGNQSDFDLRLPTSIGSATGTSSATAVSIPWLSSYSGPTWNFAWVRKSNVLIDRIETRMGNVLNTEQKAHWTAIGKFFRAWYYANMVAVFGDVPYYTKEVASDDYDELYKSRTERNVVMDSVYKDLKFAMANVRTNDGDLRVNKYVVAAVVTRLALYEGTWQKYHYNDTERAKKFLELVIEASEIVDKGGFAVKTSFRELFSSLSLASNKDCILYRHYDPAQNVTHSMASYCNLIESRGTNANLDLIKAFICVDGKPYNNSEVANAKNFEISNLIKTRDSRFEATFWDKPTTLSRSTLLYTTKFIDRSAVAASAAGNTPPEYKGSLNPNDYPVLRYAEVLLNWIEAKAELATMGGVAVSQGDIDRSINAIRARDLAPQAISKGVTKTAPLNLADLPADPDRDGDVVSLLWEIRRERRMEFAFEYSRIRDIRRWKKIEYMNTEDPKRNDLLLGVWTDLSKDAPALLTQANKGAIAVTDASGKVIVFNGTNGASMVGFYSPTNVKGRKPYFGQPGINPYLSPVGTNQRAQYKNKGVELGKPYELAQTEGWSDAM